MKFFKKKRILFLLGTISILGSIYIFSIISNFVKDGYDRQSKLVLTLKSIISPHYVKKIKDNFFVLSKLKSRNEFLELQLRKYEQGFNGEKFKSQIVKIGDQDYTLDHFFTPFKRLDVNLGWNAITNSLRAHYLEIFKDEIFVISGEGQTIYFDKQNLKNEKLNFTNLPNNIDEILNRNNSKLIGIRDLFIDNDKILISMMTKDERGVTIDIYMADLNYKKLNFNLFFKSNEYWEKYNVFSGGRIEKFKDENILFSIGYSGVPNVAQNLNSLLGKIIKINLKTKDHKIISIGHRNPQGLRYINDKDIIINSEHGPVGGDEINFNNLNDANSELKNYGWDIASYGTAYDGTDPFKKSHSDYGFIEPAIIYTPSIGISEILYFEKNQHCENKCIWATSLRANSIYTLNISKNFKKLISSNRLHLKKNRIRDIDYDHDSDTIILLSENIPSILTLRKITN
jgi:hypothetical protein